MTSLTFEQVAKSKTVLHELNTLTIYETWKFCTKKISDKFGVWTRAENCGTNRMQARHDNKRRGTCEQVEVSVLRYEYSAFYDCGTSMKRLRYDHSTTVYDCCTATVLLPQGALYYDWDMIIHARRLRYDYGRLWYDNTATAIRLCNDYGTTVIRV